MRARRTVGWTFMLAGSVFVLIHIVRSSEPAGASALLVIGIAMLVLGIIFARRTA